MTWEASLGQSHRVALDNPNRSLHRRHSISIWIAPDDATVENGCMYYLPGTRFTSALDGNGDILYIQRHQQHPAHRLLPELEGR